MPTTLPVSRNTLHVRGNWSARSDRLPSAVCLGLLWVGMLAGFGMDIKRYVHTPNLLRVLHVHAVVFTLWMVLITAQVLLVLGDRIAWHKRLGWVSVGWACLMAILGPWAAMAAVAKGPDAGSSFLSVNFIDILGFLILLAWGIALRKNPAAHKRLMMLSTISLADPGFSRVSGYLLPEPQGNHLFLWFLFAFYGNVLLIAVLAVWDWWRGRLLRSFVVGAAGLLAAEYLATWLYFWGPWKAFAIQLTHTWRSLNI